MIKYFTITLLLVISLTSCVITTKNNEIIVLNNTENLIEVDIYNTWSGETETKWTIQKGINKFSLSGDNLYGLYAKGYPEKTLYTHPNVSLTFEPDELILDEINKEINAHYVWSQQIVTGESQSIFHWHKIADKLSCIKDWETFDSILYKFIEDPEFKIKSGVLNSQHLNSYPAAYVLIDKLCESNHISIKRRMEFIQGQLIKSGIPNATKNNFLNHYLLHQSLSLRNDSIIMLSNEYFPEVAKKLTVQYEKLQKDAKLYKGMQFPDFKSNQKIIKNQNLTEGYDYTLIDFWATWCIPCIKQMPEMNQYAIDLQDKIQFVSLSVDNERDLTKYHNISDKYNAINHYWLSDTTTIREELGIKGLPRMVLLNKEGKIIDPNFPHLYEPLAKLWIKSLANRPTEKVVEKH
ncbi:MAG: hypothetical protein C0599_09190 [Salinivirgaceae bacterium]|nr:MAG: hypothetical protein C0599_09190 [Salinivirgaceae bacterium]